MQRLHTLAQAFLGEIPESGWVATRCNKMVQVIQESSTDSAHLSPFFGPRKLTLTFHRIFDHEAVDLDKVQTQRAEHFQFAKTDGNYRSRCNST